MSSVLQPFFGGKLLALPANEILECSVSNEEKKFQNSLSFFDDAYRLK